MTPTEILYEPLPVGRIGVRTGDEKVIVAKDYACFASLLEEYVAHGAVAIAIPMSSPEAQSINEMPLLLRRRIRVVNDDREEEAIERIFYGIRRELGITVSADTRQLVFPKEMPLELRKALSSIHANAKKLVLAFNYQLQAEVDIERASQSFRYTREKIQDSNSRLILAHFEGLLNHYEATKYDSYTPKGSTRIELINAFDSLANDSDYIQYSDAIQSLANPQERSSALFKLKELSRTLSSKKLVGVTWDYFSKIVKVWTGIPIPESKELSVFSNNRPLPALINMQVARDRAVKGWLESGTAAQPLTREGKLVSDEKIRWLPPMPSMKVSSPDDSMFSLGTVSQLLDALNKVKDQLGPEE